MRALLFDYPGSKLEPLWYATTMRMAYLLSNQVVYAGRAAELYNIISKGSSLSVKQKAEALKYGDFDEEFLENVLTAAKNLPKLKNGHAKASAMSHKMQKTLNDLFEMELEDIIEQFYRKTFIKAEDVWGQPGVFKRLQVNMNPERSEKNIPAYSDWLLLNMEETEGDIIMLPIEFLPTQQCSEVTDTSTDKKDNEGGYVEHCISLPFLFHSSMEELQLIRNHADAELDAFKKVMNRYIDLFVDNENNVNTVSFFKKQVRPCAEALHKKWQKYSLLGDLTRRGKVGVEQQVWLGEVPVQAIWNFYKAMDVIPPETWKRLQQAAAEDEKLQGNWPVIIMYTRNENNVPVAKPKETETLQKRRTIKL